MNPVPPRPSTEPPLPAVLLGLGERGGTWLSVLAGPEAAALGVVPVAVYDPDPERALRALAQAGQALPVVSDLGQALSRTPALVIDCLSPHARLAIAGEALRAGADVLCEPPLAVGEEAARELMGAAARGPGRLAVAYVARHRSGPRQLRALVGQGRLGRPRLLRAEMQWTAGPATASPMMLRGPAAQAFDAARAILGCDALSVRCTLSTGPGRGAPDAGLDALFEMADGSTFAFGGRAATDGSAAGPRESWRLVLEGGSADWDGESPVRAWTSAAEGPVPVVLPPLAPQASGLAGALEAAVTPLRAGRPPQTGPRDAAASLAMALSAIRSAERNGRPEPVRPLGLMSDASASPPRRRSRASLSPEAS